MIIKGIFLRVVEEDLRLREIQNLKWIFISNKGEKNMDNNEMSNADNFEDENEPVVNEDVVELANGNTIELTEDKVVTDSEGPSFVEKTTILISHLKDCYEAVIGLGRKSSEHANALANLKQCIHNLENDARL